MCLSDRPLAVKSSDWSRRPPSVEQGLAVAAVVAAAGADRLADHGGLLLRRVRGRAGGVTVQVGGVVHRQRGLGGAVRGGQGSGGEQAGVAQRSAVGRGVLVHWNSLKEGREQARMKRGQPWADVPSDSEKIP